MAEEEPSENSYSLQNDRRVVFLTKAHDLLPFFLNILRVITPIIVTRISSSVPRIPYFIVGGAAIDHIQISGQYPPPPVPLSSETVDLDIQVNSLVNSITNTTIPLQDDTLDQYIAYFYQVAKLLFDTIQFNYRPENPLFADLDPVDLAIEVAEQSKYGATPIPSIQLLTADNKVSIQGFYMISPKVKYIKLLACVQYRGIHDHILEYYIPESDFFIRESPLVLNGLPYTPLPLLFHQQIITALYRANRLDSKSKESPDYLREFVKIRIHTERILYLLYILDSFLFPDKDSPLNPAFTPLYAKVQASLVSFTALFEDGKEISAPILEVSHKWFTLFPGYYDIFKRFFVPYKNLKVLKDTFFSSARSLSPAAAEFQPPGEASDAVAADAAEPGLAANAAEVPVDDFINLGEGDVGLAGNPVVPLPPPPPPPPSAPVLLVGENAPLAQVPPEKAAPPLPTLTVKQLKKAAKKAAAEESARKAVEEAAARKLEEEAAAKKAAEEVAQEAASKKAAAAAKKVAEKAAAAAKKAAENAALENALRQATLASKGTTKAPAAAATPAATSTPSKKKMSIAEFKAEQAKKQAELKAEEEKKAKEESQKQKLEEYIKKKEIYDANIKSLIPKLSPFDTDFLTDGPIEVEPLKLSTHFINQPDSLAFKPFVISTSVEPFSGIQSKCLATIQYFIHFRIEETKPFLLLHLLPEFTYKYSQPAAFPSMISMYETNYTYFTHRIIIFLFQLFDIMPSILKGGDIANQSKLYTIINDLLNFNNKFSLLATIQEGIRLQVSALFMKLANPAYIDHVFTEIKDPSKKDSLDSIHSDLFNKIFGLTLGLLSLLLHLEVAKYKMYPEDLDAWPFADSKPALETLDDPTSPEFPFSTHNISDFIFRFAETLRSKSLTPSYYVESIIVKQLIREFFHYVRALSLKKRITGRIQSMLREGKLKEAPNVYFYFPKESLDKMTVDPEEKVDSLFKSKLSAVGFDVQNIPFVNGTTFTDDIPNARIQSTIDDCLKNPAADTLVLDMNIERVHEFYQKELEILLTTTKKNNVDGARADMSDNHSFWICSLLRNLCVKQPPLLLNENFHEWKQEDIYTIEVMRGTPPKPVRIPLPTELSQFMLAHLKYLRPENDVLGVMKNVVLKGEDPELLLLKDPSTKYDEALDVHILEVYLKSLYKHAHIATDLAEHIPSYIQTIDYYPNLISYILPYQIKDIVQAPQQPDLTHVIKQLSSALKKKGGSRPGSRSDSRPASRQQRRKTVRRRKASKH